MSLIVNTNSYISAADASIYFADRMNTSIWDDAEPEDQAKALVSATDMLDELCVWNGYKSDPDQDLEFPRDDDVDVPMDIIHAQLSIALEMISQGLSSFTQSEQILTNLKAGSVSMSLTNTQSDTNTLLTNTTKSLLSKYGSCHFNSSNGIQLVGVRR